MPLRELDEGGRGDLPFLPRRSSGKVAQTRKHRLRILPTFEEERHDVGDLLDQELSHSLKDMLA